MGVILVVVGLRKNQIEPLCSKIEPAAQACPHRIRDHRMAVFHDENQTHEQS